MTVHLTVPLKLCDRSRKTDIQGAECSFPNSVDTLLIVFDFPRRSRQLGSVGCGGAR
jgi:hypothetical protein